MDFDDLMGAHARLSYVQGRHEAARLDRELSGCDWCCGGGSERRRRAVAQQERAASALRSLGEPLPPPLCRDCDYHDATQGDRCERCATIPTTDSP